jgi:hypothetical protein
MTKIIKNGISYSNSSDNKVTQTGTNNDANYEVLLSGTADNTSRTEGVRKSSTLKYNPSSQILSTTNIQATNIQATGTITAPVQDISNLYTVTKSSGNWVLSELNAYKVGHIVQIRITFNGNGSAVANGANGFVGVLSGGPLPIDNIQNTSYYSGAAIGLNLQSDGNFNLRNMGSSITVAATSVVGHSIVFITND